MYLYIGLWKNYKYCIKGTRKSYTKKGEHVWWKAKCDKSRCGIKASATAYGNF